MDVPEGAAVKANFNILFLDSSVPVELGIDGSNKMEPIPNGCDKIKCIQLKSAQKDLGADAEITVWCTRELETCVERSEEPQYIFTVTIGACRSINACGQSATMH